MRRIAGMLFGLLLLCGCGPSVVVDGERYDALTEEDQEKLVLLARSSLKRSPKAVNATELSEILRADPTIQIKYTGDRTGIARVGWTVHGRQITVVFLGHFLTDEMKWLLETRADSEEIIDQSRRAKQK